MGDIDFDGDLDSDMKRFEREIGEAFTGKREALANDHDIDEILQKCLKTLESKGKDYTIGSKDRLHNFRTVGEFTGVGMMATWGVYFYKHVSAVFSFIKNNGQVESEPIEERIVDCIVYLLLFSKMAKEVTKRAKEGK